MKHVFDTTIEGFYLHSKSDGELFNLAHHTSESNVLDALIRNILFADAAAAATQTQEETQTLINLFSETCTDFGISAKKTNFSGQDVDVPPIITIDD